MSCITHITIHIKIHYKYKVVKELKQDSKKREINNLSQILSENRSHCGFL